MKTFNAYPSRIIALLLAVISLVFSSCEHKDLCYHHHHLVKLRLIFDWRDCTDPERPVGMCVYFYPKQGGQPLLFHFDNIEGGEVEIPAGDYVALSYNNDAPSVQTRFDHAHDLHELFTREGGLFEPLGIYRGNYSSVPRVPGGEDERVIICPDMMWGCAVAEIEVDPQGVSYICVPEKDKDPWLGIPPTVTENTITLFPHELTCIYTYEIRNVRNMEQITKMCASLSGMAPTLRVFDEELGRECVTHPFDAVARPSVNKITGRFITFGHHEENPQAHRMMLYVWTKDGKQYCYGSSGDQFDLTDQVHAAPNRRRVHLIIDGLDIPTPVQPETGGMAPDIDDWGEVFVDLEM